MRPSIFLILFLTSSILNLSSTFLFLPQKFSAHCENRHIKMSQQEFELVLLRHGESTWNHDNIFTGWVDVPLTSDGELEAVEAGRIMADHGYKPDIAYTSFLKRAIKTLWISLEQLDLMHIPVVKSWRLNERHYGALQGLNKKETVLKYGKPLVQSWRRSYLATPPKMTPDSLYWYNRSDVSSAPPANASSSSSGSAAMYDAIPPQLLPVTESLKDLDDRVIYEWNKVILPTIQTGKKVLIVCHGNTMMALLRHLEEMPETSYYKLNIPNGVPLYYKLDPVTWKPLRSPNAMAPLKGEYLGNHEVILRRIMSVSQQLTIQKKEEQVESANNEASIPYISI